MTVTFKIADLLNQDKMYDYIKSNSSIPIDGNNAVTLLKQVCRHLSKIERFNDTNGLEHWMLDISLTEDEGIEVMVYHDELELITFLLEDDDEYDEDEIEELFGIDSFYTSSYQGFLEDPNNVDQLLHEMRMWEIESNFHQFAIDHLEAVLNKGYNLSPFGGKSAIEVEFSFDEEEIFVGCIDDNYDTTSTSNPDYNLPHHQFDPENIEESLELGIQSWTEFSEEDDSWEDLDEDEDWPEDDDYDADWDSDTDDEWDPGFEEDD